MDILFTGVPLGSRIPPSAQKTSIIKRGSALLSAPWIVGNMIFILGMMVERLSSMESFGNSTEKSFKKIICTRFLAGMQVM